MTTDPDPQDNPDMAVPSGSAVAWGCVAFVVVVVIILACSWAWMH